MQEWFTAAFNPSAEGGWTSSCDIPEYDDENWTQKNDLFKMCNSLRDIMDLQWSSSNHASVLYNYISERPDIYMQWHNSSGGSFYLAFGCANCQSCTPHYQPQREPPHNLDQKRAKVVPAQAALMQ